MTNNATFNFSGLHLLITGGAGILGSTVCRHFAKAGASLTLVDIRGEECEDLAAELRARYGIHALGLGCDITDEAQVCSAVSRAVSAMGPITTLLNNAATKSSDMSEFFAPFETFSLKTWQAVMNVNVDAMFLVSKYVGQNMIHSGTRGSVINVSSIYGVVGPDQRMYVGSEYLNRQINTPAVYAASKAAVIGLTRYLATYWGEQGIRVNSITPGGIESGQNEIFQRRYGERVPLGRMATAEEIASGILFLASDLSSYLTGHNLIVDGGFTVW